MPRGKIGGTVVFPHSNGGVTKDEKESSNSQVTEQDIWYGWYRKKEEEYSEEDSGL